MSALRAIGLRLGVACALLTAPLAAQATLFLQGPTKWYRGETITVEVVTDEDTLVNVFSFDAQYGAFSSVLEIINDPVDTLPTAIKATNPCNRDDIGDICAFFAAPPRSIPQGTVVAWEFLVKEDAPLGPITFNFDLFINADVGPFDGLPGDIIWPEGKQFEVVAIPEPSSWALMLAGLAAVGARAYRRRSASA